MALTLRVFKKLVDGVPTDEYSYEQGTLGNDGQGGLDPIYFSVAIIPANPNEHFYAPDEDGKTVYVKLEGTERGIDLKVRFQVIGTNDPPTAVIDGGEAFNPNTNQWENAYSRWVMVSSEGTPLNPNTVVPVKLRIRSDSGDPVGLWNFFVTFLIYNIGS
ncbi:MAG: hypothetical protein QW815_01165 [Nitrososphaerota archaeon]